MEKNLAKAGVSQSTVIGLMGFGRFGRALAELFADAGYTIRAFDPAGVSDAAVDAGSPAGLALEAPVILLAVPVPTIRTALEQLRPGLSASHFVMDVASVKVSPEAALRSVLGEDLPWAATHPLFGPTSLARGERPLKVVVCPNPQHPRAAERAATIYRRSGCSVIERSAEAHDREMSESHAIAYFIAKGLLDADLAIDSALAPPSAQAILRTVEAVRSDAGHLFSALHRENPFASGARSRFLEALGKADARLSAPPATPSRPAGTGFEAASSEDEIPELCAASPELREARGLIDEVDRELLALLARRARIAERASRAKTDLGQGVRDEGREQALRALRREWAASYDLDPSDVDDVFKAILDFSRRLQYRQRS